MAQNPVSRVRLAALILSCVGLALAASSAMAAQGSVTAQPAAETASDALSRHLRVLATAPRNFQSLIAAGRAALDLGDTQAAAGFFGRADEVWPTSPLPQIGMGAATALDGDPQGALMYFDRAAKLGASAVTMGADRGLAYDLLGRHAEAQTDYRAALAGNEADEARRRLALSLAITGDRTGAIASLAPLLARRDQGAIRNRALVLALTGDQAGARDAIEWTMPGGWAQMAPFLSRLGSLNSAQKAAAVHLGVFPGSGQPSTGTVIAAVPRDRLGDIDALLRAPAEPAPAAPSAAAQRPQAASAAPSTQVAAPATRVSAATASASVTATPRKRFWVQLASGPNAAALPEQFRRTKSRSDELLDGLNGYVTEDGGRARLLVGPFRDREDAEIFAEQLESTGVRAFSWISAEGQPIRKITTE